MQQCASVIGCANARIVERPTRKTGKGALEQVFPDDGGTIRRTVPPQHVQHRGMLPELYVPLDELYDLTGNVVASGCLDAFQTGAGVHFDHQRTAVAL